ncbi:MAG: ABC transporter ATP-binding protein [Pseudomonadota bacterium]
MLRVQDVRKSYVTPQGPVPVLAGVDLALGAGETLALTGESGSGKSTLLHLIAGLDSVDGGSIALGDRDIGALDEAGRAALRRTEVGLVFQQFNLIPSLSVEANLSFQARLADRYDAVWVQELAARLGLAELLQRYPEQLSGGQQQRVAIGRALAARPALLLADEPTGNLDEQASDAVMDLTADLVARTGCAFLMVTHSRDLAARLDRRVHLSNGKVQAVETPPGRAATG